METISGDIVSRVDREEKTFREKGDESERTGGNREYLERLAENSRSSSRR